MIKYKNNILNRTLIAATDQGLLSGLNFIVQIILIKTVTKDEYGYYSLGLSIIMYLMSFQNAVVNTPITVTLAERDDKEKRIYLSSVFKGQLFFLVIVCGIGTISSLVSIKFSNDIFISLFIMSLFIGSFGVLNREFLRSYFFAEETPLRVLKLDLLYGLMYLFLIGVTFYLYKISVPLILIFMGIASGFDSLILNKSFNFKANFEQIKNAYRENWQISKWSLIGITVTHLQGFAYLYIIGYILGSKAMGEVSASRLLLMPLGIFINGWGNVIRPFGAKLREKGELKKFFKSLIIASSIFPVIVFAITMIILIFSDSILKIFFTKNYSNIFNYLIFWAILTSVGFAQANASYGLQVIKKFKSLALINTSTMVLTIISSFLLTSNYQIKGALTASMIGTITFASILWILLYREIFKKSV